MSNFIPPIIYEQCEKCGYAYDTTYLHECPNCTILVCDNCSGGRSCLCFDCENKEENSIQSRDWEN